jgi:hypothetical protein
MNTIVAALLYHTCEEIAFELAIRALNEYHLKEVHMIKLVGFEYHCELLGHILAEMLPQLSTHFKEH